MSNLLNHFEINGIKHFGFSYRDVANAAMDNAIRPDHGCTPKSQMSPRQFTDILQQAIARSQGIPARIREQAEQHSGDLADTLKRFAPVLRRNLASGALDSSKLARLASPGISAREFDALANRAYRRREAETRHKQIRVAVVGDFNWRIRSQNPKYAPTLAGLIHVISQACVIAGIPCAAYGTRGVLHTDGVSPKVNDGTRKFAATAILKDYGDEMNGPTFAMLEHETTFSHAYGAAMNMGGHNAYGSVDGTGGLDFAAERGADFIIGIGKFRDTTRPNVALDAGTTVEAAMHAIVTALELDAAA